MQSTFKKHLAFDCVFPDLEPKAQNQQHMFIVRDTLLEIFATL